MCEFRLANDSSEYKIITEAFLYKYLNDRMIYELGGLKEFTTATMSNPS